MSSLKRSCHSKDSFSIGDDSEDDGNDDNGGGGNYNNDDGGGGDFVDDDKKKSKGSNFNQENKAAKKVLKVILMTVKTLAMEWTRVMENFPNKHNMMKTTIVQPPDRAL